MKVFAAECVGPWFKGDEFLSPVKALEVLKEKYAVWIARIPGDQLIIKTEVLKRKGKIYKLAAKAFVDEQLAAEATLMAAFGG